LETGLGYSGIFTRGQSFDSPRQREPRVMTEQLPVVFVVDADVSIRSALRSLILSVGLSVEFFSSPVEFLQGKRPDAPSCLVLEVWLPGKNYS
jgi:hypothetical protein